MRRYCMSPNASCLSGIEAIDGGFDINTSLICSTLAFGRRFDAPSASRSLESAMILGVFLIEMGSWHRDGSLPLGEGSGAATRCSGGVSHVRKLGGKLVFVSCSKGRGEL